MAKTPIPSVSTFRFFRHANQILKNPLPFHHDNFEKLGDTFQLNAGFGRRVIFSRDAKLAEYALQKNQKNYTKSPIQTRDLAKYVGNGLLTATGQHWKKQRKLIQPAFHKKQLFSLLEKMQSAISIELSRITTTGPIDVFPIFNDLAFQVVVKSLFGLAVAPEDITKLQFITEANQKMLVKELRQSYKGFWFRWNGEIEKHLELSREARAILTNIVLQRKKSSQKPGDLLDMLLEARYEDGRPMEDEQLIDELLILFTAGHETTSNALSFTCQLLARHPQIQEKVYREVKIAEARSQNLMEYLKNCSYTQQVIEESMRLYPPAYFIDRVSLEDDEFEGKKIPKGSSLLFSYYEIHRHKDFWERPQVFNPDRFGEGNEIQYSAYYFPFGAGPRKCIGNNFAMYEMILAISGLLSNYKILEEKGPIKIKPLITLKPQDAILQFKKP